MKFWGLASWQVSFMMSSSHELNCKSFYDELSGSSTSRFSGRRQRWLMNALGFFPPLMLSGSRLLGMETQPANGG